MSNSGQSASTHVWWRNLWLRLCFEFTQENAQVPVAKPSDLLYTRILADGSEQVELIEAERRLFCVYKWVHGIKFQAVALSNGMIVNMAGA